MAPATGLIVHPADWNARVVTEQERSNRAVAHEQDIALLLSFEHAFDLTNNTGLRVNGTLPTSNALIWLCEEFISRTFELGGGKNPVAERSFSCIASRISKSALRAAAII